MKRTVKQKVQARIAEVKADQRRDERRGRTSVKDSYDPEAWKAWGEPIEITPQGFVEPIRAGQQTCSCTAVHFPCPLNLYR
jgi:hypothetical protein